MTDTEYKQLKTKYRKWKKFLVTEFANYEKAKAESSYDFDPKKEAMVESYEAVKAVVIEMEGYGLGLVTKTAN